MNQPSTRKERRDHQRKYVSAIFQKSKNIITIPDHMEIKDICVHSNWNRLPLFVPESYGFDLQAGY